MGCLMGLVVIIRSDSNIFKKAEEEREKAFKKSTPRTTRTTQKARSEEI
jgi:hypothetical protein